MTHKEFFERVQELFKDAPEDMIFLFLSNSLDSGDSLVVERAVEVEKSNLIMDFLDEDEETKYLIKLKMQLEDYISDSPQCLN